MSNLQQPIINWAVMKGDSKAGFAQQRILLIAQGNAGFYGEVQPNEASELLGSGTMAHMAYARIYDNNPATPVDVIGLAEPTGGMQAEGGLKFTGTAIESKNIRFRVGDDKFKLDIAILKDDTAEAIAIKFKDALNATTYPFTAEIDGGDATLVKVKFKIKGEMANNLIITHEQRLSGIQITAIKFTGGAGAYDTNGILDGLTERYQTVIFDECADLEAIETFLNERFNQPNAVMGGVGITVKSGTYNEVKTFADAKNSKTMCVIGNLEEMRYNALGLLLSAEIGAKRALRLTDGAMISHLVLDAEEAYGGINKSSLPYHNTPMSYKKPQTQITLEQANNLNDAGISLLVPTPTGTALGALVTLYKYDKAGQKDAIFHFLNAVDTSLAVQEYLFVSCKKEYGQTRATHGDLKQGASIVNEMSLKAFISSLYEDMEDYLLVQSGKTQSKIFKDNLSVKLDLTKGVFSVLANKVPLVGQFRGLNGVIAVGFDFE